LKIFLSSLSTYFSGFSRITLPAFASRHQPPVCWLPPTPRRGAGFDCRFSSDFHAAADRVLANITLRRLFDIFAE
jgi:hypothetical protein